MYRGAMKLEKKKQAAFEDLNSSLEKASTILELSHEKIENKVNQVIQAQETFSSEIKESFGLITLPSVGHIYCISKADSIMTDYRKYADRVIEYSGYLFLISQDNRVFVITSHPTLFYDNFSSDAESKMKWTYVRSREEVLAYMLSKNAQA
jgi:predicted GTPase